MINNTKTYIKRMLRRRLCKCVIIPCSVLALSFYISLFLHGDLETPRVMNLTDLDRCPACYGVTVCADLNASLIILKPRWANIFSAKNIYHGHTKFRRRIMLKKLAHDWELKDFDSKLCGIWNLEHSCRPVDLLNVSNVNEKIIETVSYNISWPDMEPRKGLVMCPYAYSFSDLIQPILKNENASYKAEALNIWTMLTINPEPIILQVLSKSKGWPVPAYAGVCGRVELVAYEGEPLSKLTHVNWYRKLLYTQQILKGAMDFTFKHDRFRFYLMDWSLDNIVANENDQITFVDLEDVVIVDKHTSPNDDLPNWYQDYAREDLGPGFTFSIENICKHHLSDHNIWAACYILAGDDDAFLYHIPKEINGSKSKFDRLLNACLYSNNRFQDVVKLQRIVNEALLEEKICPGLSLPDKYET